MKQQRRRPSNAIDGFVPRKRVARTPRTGVPKPQELDVTDGFIPHATDATQPVVLDDDTWNDENTLTINPEELEGKRGRPGKIFGAPQEPPKWWQFGKKRRLKKGKPEPTLRKKIAKRSALVILLAVLGMGVFLGWKFLRTTSKVFNGNILGILNTTKLKGEEDGRVNILLAGNSADDKGHDGANLTDSIMLVSLNTKDNTAFMMSIPRDLYVSYGVKTCSVGYQGKINAAYVCGEETKFSEEGYADGGMGLLQKVVYENFGVKTNYYALVNYGAFRDAVDAVGGINITIKSNDPRGIYDPSLDYTSRTCCSLAKYPNGPVTLNGKQALNLARARGDSYGSYGFAQGDFVRTEHQRQMLIALKEKTLSAGTLSNPAKIGSLFDSIGSNVKTDFQVSELRRLYDLGKKVQSNNIQSIGLTDSTVNLVTTGMINGQSVVMPTAGASNFNQIKAYMLKLTSNDPLIREGAKVTILNASGVVGAAQSRSDALSAKGITVLGVGNAASKDATVIVDLTNGKKNNTKSYLQKQFGVTVTTDVVANPEAKAYTTSDFVIFLGKQTATSTSSTSSTTSR